MITRAVIGSRLERTSSANLRQGTTNPWQICCLRRLNDVDRGFLECPSQDFTIQPRDAQHPIPKFTLMDAGHRERELRSRFQNRSAFSVAIPKLTFTAEQDRKGCARAFWNR